MEGPARVLIVPAVSFPFACFTLNDVKLSLMRCWGSQRLLIVGQAFHLSILGTDQAPVQAGRKGKASEWGLLNEGLVRPWAVPVGTFVQWSERALGKMCLKIPRFPVQVTQPPA